VSVFPGMARFLLSRMVMASTAQFIGASYGSGAGPNINIVLSKPTGTQDGDLLIAFTSAHNVGGSSGGVIPTGWMGIGDPMSVSSYRAWAKVASPSDPPSWVFNHSTNSSPGGTAMMVAYRGISCHLPWITDNNHSPFASSPLFCSHSGWPYSQYTPVYYVPRPPHMYYGNQGCYWANSYLVVGFLGSYPNSDFSNYQGVNDRAVVNSVYGCCALVDTVWDRGVDGFLPEISGGVWSVTLSVGATTQTALGLVLADDDQYLAGQEQNYMGKGRKLMVPMEGD